MNDEFIEAAKTGDIDKVRLLLNDKRVEPAADNNHAIRGASYYGYLEVVRLLLNDIRVDPAANNNYAIRMASRNGHTEVVKLLLTDSRVDWRLAGNTDQMVKDSENKLKSELTTSYLSLERSTPQIGFEWKVKSQIPKEIIKQTVYSGPYEELCMAVKNSKIPPV